MTTATPRSDARTGPFAGLDWAVVVPAVVAGGLYAAMLAHLVYRGWAHSYDSAIYVRSLWGVANRDLFNPMVDLHVLSIHGNFVLYLLAPFARVFHPATVLISAQATALALTVAMACSAYRRVAVDAGLDRWSRIGASFFAAFGLVVGAPMLANPFLFDIRPDLLGVPLLTWGLLRAHRRGAFDWKAVAVMLSSLLVREEYMMVIVGALVVTPFPRPLTANWRLRLVGTVAALGYWALYWFGFRNWIGDGSYAIAQEVGSAFLDAAELTTGQIALYKAELLAVFFAAAGGTVVVGWRWCGPALPGLLFLLISSRMQELVLNFHYVQFVVPGLIVASVAGFERWLDSQRRGGGRLPMVSAAAITICFVTSSALPGGGRHRDENFFLSPSHDVEEYLLLQEAHRLVAGIPPGVGAAIPHELAAPLADRSLILPTNTYVERVTPESAPSGVDWVVLPGNRWGSTGRMLVDRHGFRLVHFLGRRLALLARNPSAAPNWLEVNAVDRPMSCRTPLATWDAAGFELCGAEAEDGRLRVTIVRNAPPDARLVDTPLAVIVVDPASGATVGASMLGGLIPVQHLPVGGSGVFVTDQPVAGESGQADVAIVLPDGGAVPVTRPGSDEATPGARVTW